MRAEFERREFGVFMAEEQAKYGRLGNLQVGILASAQAMAPVVARRVS